MSGDPWNTIRDWDPKGDLQIPIPTGFRIHQQVRRENGRASQLFCLVLRNIAFVFASALSSASARCF